MKELGEYLKEKREEMGVGLEEAAEDLNLNSDDVENIEEGNTRAFKDMLELKGIIKEYAKYLGLDPEKVVDEFNDFLFEHTSRISLEDILNAKQQREEEEKKVYSPYTKIRKRSINFDRLMKLRPLLIEIIIFLVLLLVAFIYLRNINEDKPNNRNSELMGLRGEEIELA